LRDTDADWRELGATEPYWAVLAAPEFLQANLDPDGVAAFYASGERDVAGVVERLCEMTGGPPTGPALDFGCGVGRLAEAMSAYADKVTGYDVSPGMLEIARRRGGCVTYVDELPDGPFNWINSYLVFQHIPPARGLERLEALLRRLAPGGRLSLQFTICRDPHLQDPPPRGWRRVFPALAEARRLARLPTGTMMMYDYDLTEIVKRLNQAGVSDIALSCTDHGGLHGAMILARKPL